MNDVMDFRSPSEKVFALEEITEIILGFLSYHEMDTTKLLELRTVNKCWRKALLPVLIDSYFFLNLDISSQTSLQEYTKRFPADSCLPMHVKISNENWSNDQLTFLKDYARVITRISFEKMPAFSEERSSNLDNMTTSFPRLEDLEVSPPPGSLYLPPTAASGNIIKRILYNTKKLQFFRLVVPRDDRHAITSVQDIPDGITFIDFRGVPWTNEICQVFMAADTSKIKFLSIDIVNDNLSERENPIGKFTNKVISSLEVLKIGVESSVLICIPAASKLQILQVKNVDFQIEPKGLCHLGMLNIVGPLLNVLDNLEKFIRASPKYTELESLDLSIIDIDDLELSDELVDRATQVQLEMVKLCPHLKYFETNFVLHEIAAVIFPAVFQYQQNLKRMYVELIRVDEESFDLSSLLTGIPFLEIPLDRADWINIIGPRNVSISNLQCLEYLELVNTDEAEVQVSDFVFEELSAISSLKSISFTGNFQMDKEVTEKWLNQNSGRTIIFEDYDKDICDKRIWTVGLDLK